MAQDEEVYLEEVEKESFASAVGRDYDGSDVLLVTSASVSFRDDTASPDADCIGVNDAALSLLFIVVAADFDLLPDITAPIPASSSSDAFPSAPPCALT